MAVQPVTYKNDSSTPGFAEAGDSISITSSNANTIRKDVDQGNTENLNNAQQKWLDKWVDEDTLDYSNEEMEKVGEQQIDTKGEDGEDLSEKNGKGGAAAATVASVGAGLLFASATAISMASTKTCNIAAAGFAQLAMSIGAGVAAAGSIVSITAFDPAKNERKSQTSNASTNNAIIQQYYDTLDSDMNTMLEESGTYAELSDMTTQMTMDSITNIGAMQAEMQVYQAQGNTEKVAELKGQIEELQGNSEKELEEPQKEMDTIKENVEQYTGNNAEAVGVKTSGDTVAEFLKTGEQLKIFADINQYALLVCALCSFAAVASSFPKLPFGIDFAPSTAAKILYGVAGALFTTAALKMKDVSKIEGDAGKAGDEMASNLENLQANIDGQAGFTEATAAGYVETDEASTEMTEQTQKETDKANEKQAQNLMKSAGKKETNSTGNTNGNTSDGKAVSDGNSSSGSNSPAVK